jgi:UDP-N-acetylmuramyl pentapeptide synthase
MKSLFKKIITGILSWEANAVIRKHKPSIIAITGSVGKTSAKDATYHILASAGVFVRKSEKSFNSEIGVPLTILGLQNAWNRPIGWIHNIFQGLGAVYPVLGGGGPKSAYPKCLVLEVGADHPGDIEGLTRWLRPDIAVITAVSKVPVHVEFFPSPEAVLKEKLALARGIREGGKLVLPANDPAILAVRNETPAKGAVDLSKAPCLTFAIGSPADVVADSPEIIYELQKKDPNQPGIGAEKPVGMTFNLKYGSDSAKVSIIGVAGIQHIHSITAAAAVALSYEVSFAAVVASIPQYQAPRGRMNLLEGIVGSVLIDDTYNASPDAVQEALRVLGMVKAGRKIAVLGDMMELGKFSPEEHRKAGERVAQAFKVTGVSGADDASRDILVTVGIRARDIAEGAIAVGMPEDMIQSFDTSVQAGEWLRNLLHKESILQGDPGTVILIKGSQSPRMERVTFALLDDQSRAAEFLVRQDAEWLAKK